MFLAELLIEGLRNTLKPVEDPEQGSKDPKHFSIGRKVNEVSEWSIHEVVPLC